MSSIIDTLKNNDLEMKFENDTLFIMGSIDFRDPGKIIGPFFEKLHKELLKSDIKEISIDVTKLFFLNSSGIREFVEWIMKADSTDPVKRYSMIFLTNSSLPWQESTFSTLVYLNPEFVKRIIKM
jgi:hypothetical protein